MDTIAIANVDAGRTQRSGRVRANISAMLSFEAPYLLDKLMRLGVVESRQDAQALFHEVIKYIVLCELHPERELPMISRRVDEVWHQFALFTKQYHQFCAQFIGGFFHHAPNEIKPYVSGSDRRTMPREEFEARYAEHFGPISPAWFDENALNAQTRLARESWVERLCARASANRAELVLDRQEPLVLCCASTRALAAYEFIATHPVFLLRELPGLKSDEERSALCRPLVQLQVLCVAP
jgi:hypothetical protein